MQIKIVSELRPLSPMKENPPASFIRSELKHLLCMSETVPVSLTEE